VKAFRIKAQDKASPGSSRARCGTNQRDELVAQVERRALN
jgi:hypothetical protein